MNTDDLISLLRKNARASTEDLARELNVDEERVAEEIAQLEREGVVMGYQAIVNPQLLSSSTVEAVVEVRLTPERGGGFDRRPRGSRGSKTWGAATSCPAPTICS